MIREMYKRNNYLKLLVWLFLFIPLYYLYIVPTYFSLANSIKTIDTDLLKKELSNSDSKIIIIDFWATWCSPCQKQISVLSSLYEQYKTIGLTIIGVSLDDTKEKVNKFVNKQGIKYPVYLGDNVMSFDYDIHALPTTYIYNKDRDLVEKHVGLIKENELKQIMENILKTNQSEKF